MLRLGLSGLSLGKRGGGGGPYLGLTGTHDYYIDATLGNDANDGSEGAPWASLSKITSAILPAAQETKVLVRAGTYDTASDYLLVDAALNASLIVAFEPGCVMDGTAANIAAAKNGMEFAGVNDWSATIYGNGLTVQNYNYPDASSPNGVGNRATHHLTVHDVYVDNCEDGFSCHDNATMITYDCSAVNCIKSAFVHVVNATVEHHRCYFDVTGSTVSNGAYDTGVIMALVDTVVVGGGSLATRANSTVSRCQLGTMDEALTLPSAGGTITDSFLNVYQDGDDPKVYRRCYGKFSTRLRTPGGMDMQDCVIVGPATGQSAVVFSNFNSGGNIAMTFSGNVVATPSFQSFDATNAGQLLAGGATFAGNSLWAGAAYDADLDASLISGTITTDPQIGSADSYLMADYASAAGLAGFGSGDVVERPAAIPRALP